MNREKIFLRLVLFFLNISNVLLKKCIIKKVTRLANGITIPISLNRILLLIADKYCMIEIIPNLKCIFDKPKIILCSFRKLV